MNAKDYLAQAMRLDQRIQSKLEQVSSLRELASRVSVNHQAEMVRETMPYSPMKMPVLKMVDLVYEIDADMDKLIDLKREIIDVINSVEQPEYRLLLELRYLNSETWEEIADRMNYSWRNIHYVHAKALRAVEEILSYIDLHSQAKL